MIVKAAKGIRGFVWDSGNINKNWKKHRVTSTECEEAFFDENKVALKDVLHSGKEERFIILGKTKQGHLLFVVFTVRRKKIRVISARDVNKRERKLYEKAVQNSKI